MEKMTKMITQITFIISLLALAIACYSFYNIALAKYQVNCDKTVFHTKTNDYRFKTGSQVNLMLSPTAPAIDYSFKVDGVKRYYIGYDHVKNYVLQFKMPPNDVQVSYSIAEPVNGIDIVMDENPTTGFEWQYELAPQGVIELVKDRYISEPNYQEEPVSGLGGTHFWKFKVVGSGTVEIRFENCRGSEKLYGSETIYKYECDGTNATLIEKKRVKK